MRLAARAGGALSAASGALMALLLLLLVALDVAQVAMRYLLGTGWPWAGDLAVILLLSLAWTGAGHLWLRDGHIGVSLVAGHPRLAAALRAAFGLAVVVGGLALLPLALDAMAAYGVIDLPALPAPASIKYLPVAVGVAYAALAAALRLLARSPLDAEADRP